MLQKTVFVQPAPVLTPAQERKPSETLMVEVWAGEELKLNDRPVCSWRCTAPEERANCTMVPTSGSPLILPVM
ncbi:hypothetical protein DP939_37665 [Spongiactinospora rosea]|uniref:Uncharacterized protein n=1 Tax=Spongiactinospora rosea TaxID=2248750 RepID=A0A366LM09_9ACTN|nr:hypothetical protein DP939_37665 [Spongiactinospora rosea]